MQLRGVTLNRPHTLCILLVRAHRLWWFRTQWKVLIVIPLFPLLTHPLISAILPIRLWGIHPILCATASPILSHYPLLIFLFFYHLLFVITTSMRLSLDITVFLVCRLNFCYRCSILFWAAILYWHFKVFFVFYAIENYYMRLHEWINMSNYRNIKIQILREH